MLAVKHNVPQIQDKLERIRRLVDGGWQKDSVDLMDSARKLVRMLTPKSSVTTKQHLRDGWTLHTIGRGGKDRVPVLTVVYNRQTHDPAGRPKKQAQLRVLSTKEKKDYTLLDILEHGSRGHEIPKQPDRRSKKKLLHFFTADGKEHFVKRVSHPGTRPYGMVKTVRAKLRGWMVALNRRWKKKIEREWKR